MKVYGKLQKTNYNNLETEKEITFTDFTVYKSGPNNIGMENIQHYYEGKHW